ncbi:unnamed protein product, partial [Allacma fusca]
PINSGANLT